MGLEYTIIVYVLKEGIILRKLYLVVLILNVTLYPPH